MTLAAGAIAASNVVAGELQRGPLRRARQHDDAVAEHGLRHGHREIGEGHGARFRDRAGDARASRALESQPRDGRLRERRNGSSPDRRNSGARPTRRCASELPGVRGASEKGSRRPMRFTIAFARLESFAQAAVAHADKQRRERLGARGILRKLGGSAALTRSSTSAAARRPRSTTPPGIRHSVSGRARRSAIDGPLRAASRAASAAGATAGLTPSTRAISSGENDAIAALDNVRTPSGST